MNTQNKWIAAVLGKDSLRAWAMQGSEPYAEAVCEDRTSITTPDTLPDTLVTLCADWLSPVVTKVLICGAPCGVYHAVPVNPADLPPVAMPSKDARLDLLALPGLKQSAPPDIMLGDETRIAGFLATHDGWDGVICLPGQRSCWAHVSAGEVVSFQTFITGELFSAVAHLPVLSVSASSAGWDAGFFADSLETTLSRPEKLAAVLSSVQAREVLQDPSHDQAKARILGALIGAELAAARPYWLGQQVAIIGTPDTTAHYGAALERQGVPVMAANANEMSLAGLVTAWQRL